MTRITFIIFIFFSHYCNSQITQDTIYEKEIDVLKQYLKKKPVDSIKMQVNKIFDNYEINCIQKGRIYQKLGTKLYYRGRDEEALNILRDSTILVWQQCNDLDPKHYFSAVRVLIELLDQNKRLDEAKHWIKFLESNPKHFENQNQRTVFKYYNLVGNIFSATDDYFTANEYYKKAFSILEENEKWSYRYLFQYHNTYAIHLFENNKIDESLKHYKLARQHLYWDDDDFIYYCNILSPLIASEKFEEARTIADSLKTKLLSTDDLGYKSFALKQLVKLEIANHNFEEAQIIINELDSINVDNNFNIANLAYNEDLKATLAFNQGDYELSKKFTNKAINELIDNYKIDIDNSDINFDNCSIINAESLKLILKNAFDMASAQFKKTQEKDDLSTLLNIANGISELYKKNRKSFGSEIGGLSQLSKTYNFYDKIMDIGSEYYIHTADKSVLDKLIWLSLNNKNDVLINLLKNKNIYQRYLDAPTFNHLLELENKKRIIELKISNNRSNSDNSTSDSLTQIFIETKQKIEELRSKESKKNPKIDYELKLSESSFQKFDIQKALKANTALIDIFFGEKFVYISSVTKNITELYKVELTAGLVKEIQAIISNLHDYGNINEFKELSKSVYNKILYKVVSDLENQNISNICILNDGILHEIPFESYWTGQNYLVEKFNIIYLTNIAKLKSNKVANLKSNSGFATKYSENLNGQLNKAINRSDIVLSSLNSSLSEIEITQSAFPGQIFKNEEASKLNLIKAIAKRNDILHLALHGLVIDDDNSAIIFDDHSKDFILNSSEVYKLNIQNKLTILSACYSGKGRIYSGEGIRNLARAFLYAGSQNVIPSMWSASDVSSQEIISKLVSELKERKNISQSLTKSKRDYLSSTSPAYAHPSYWSNMIFIGSPQIEGNFLTSNKTVLIAAVGLLFLIFFYFKMRR